MEDLSRWKKEMVMPAAVSKLVNARMPSSIVLRICGGCWARHKQEKKRGGMPSMQRTLPGMPCARCVAAAAVSATAVVQAGCF